MAKALVPALALLALCRAQAPAPAVGSIAGKVLDENGEPFPQASVEVVRWLYNSDWHRQQQSDYGRVKPDGSFALDGLEPGRYYICAHPDYNPNEQNPPEVYVTTWSPQSLDISSAIGIEVTAGQQVIGIEIQMQKAAVYRISGRVNGKPPFNVALQPEHAAIENLGFSLHSDDTSFKFTRLLPGAYILHVFPNVFPSTQPFARQLISIGRDNVDDLVVTPGPGAEVNGKFKIEGNPPPDSITQLRIDLEGPAVGRQRSLPVDKNGTFAFHGMRLAMYRVQVAPILPGMYVKSMRFNNQDITRAGLDLTSGGGQLEITFAPGASDITATLHASDGSPISGVPVSIWLAGPPADYGPIFPATPKTDANGAVQFRGLAPGDYRIAAWETEPLARSLDFRHAFDDRATAVKLEENSHASVELKLIPRAEIEAEASKLR